MQEIKYIDGNIVNGIEINWKLITKELYATCKKVLKKDINSVYIPKYPLYSASWFIDLSERSVGKTTQLLLIILIAHKHYGIKGEYIRLTDEGIAPKNNSKLFNTILEFNYIDIIFKGQWNSVTYKSKAWYLCKVDDEGKIIEKSSDELVHLHSLSKKHLESVKSNYNSPRGDIIFFDEFIPVDGVSREEDFLNLIQLHSTIRRQRLSTKTFLSANTINKYNHFFHELCIYKEIQVMRLGDEQIVKTPLGTSLYVHLIKFDEAITEKRRVNNLLHYGFVNPKLASVIGGTEWATKNYPHLPSAVEGEERNLLTRDIYFKYMDTFMCAEIWQSTQLGVFMYIREQTTQIFDKEGIRIYTLETVTHKRDRYAFGQGDKLDKMIWFLWKNKKTFFTYNDIGNMFEQYVVECGK